MIPILKAFFFGVNECEVRCEKHNLKKLLSRATGGLTETLSLKATAVRVNILEKKTQVQEHSIYCANALITKRI